MRRLRDKERGAVMLDKDTFDTIIIGAGIGGLTDLPPENESSFKLD